MRSRLDANSLSAKSSLSDIARHRPDFSISEYWVDATLNLGPDLDLITSNHRSRPRRTDAQRGPSNLVGRPLAQGIPDHVDAGHPGEWPRVLFLSGSFQYRGSSS